MGCVLEARGEPVPRVGPARAVEGVADLGALVEQTA
jgi:hypothetical protein